jgi:cytochrome d ubiquinol oxidase subunit II
MSEALLPAAAAVTTMFFIGGYVVLDSFDLGAGMLLLQPRDRYERDAIIKSTAATRYSSELWLIAAAIMMYFAFPFPFRMIATGLAVPIGVLIVSLILRDIAGPLRKASALGGERTWSIIFAVASVTATLAQGFSLGGYLRGFSIANGNYIGGLFGWATPFSALIAIALCAGYALIGSAWINLQVGAEASEETRRQTAGLAIVSAFFMAVISLAMLFVHPIVSARWGVSTDGIDWRYFLPLAPLPIAAAAGLAASFFSTRRPHARAGFVGALAAIIAGYIGLAASVWPYVVPYGFTAAQSAADIAELRRCLLGAAIGLPCLILLSVLSYAAWRTRRRTTRLVPSS